MVVREHWLIFGIVQGVGFRWGFKQIANSLKITGWVKNLPDGNVEAEVQGQKDRITILENRLHQGRYYDITKIVKEAKSLKPNEKDFEVHF